MGARVQFATGSPRFLRNVTSPGFGQRTLFCISGGAQEPNRWTKLLRHHDQKLDCFAGAPRIFGIFCWLNHDVHLDSHRLLSDAGEKNDSDDCVLEMAPH